MFNCSSLSGKVKVRAETELDTILSRFQSLPYYDQYCIASSTMEHIIEVCKLDYTPRDEFDLATWLNTVTFIGNKYEVI